MKLVVSPAEPLYWVLLGALVFARGMDFLSTWLATPNLLLEGNPLARRLGWKWGIPVNVLLCACFAGWPLAAVIIATTSILVAARNFQSTWMMRALGEFRYLALMDEVRVRGSKSLYVFCALAQGGLSAGLGALLAFFSGGQILVLGIGMGLVAYGVAVILYSLLALRAPGRGRSFLS